MKTVIFDFDGTLTIKGANIWKSIWQNLGYDIGKGSFYRLLFSSFIDNRISHQDWCDLTCKAFQEKEMTKDLLLKIAGEVQLLQGAEDVFKVLKSKGYSLHIVSGNIQEVITLVLGENVKYFDSINANKLHFDESGKLTQIEGTNYDFEGKAKFVEEFKEKTDTDAKDIIFVGNGGNDEWVHFSGCKTLCINPDDAESTNQTKWHKVLDNVRDLRQIIPEICPLTQKNKGEEGK